MQKLNKYNNVIITKRQDNICELQFINKDQKEIINSDDYAFLEKQLSFLKNRIKEIEELKQVVSILSKNKIKSFDNKIENISSDEEKLIKGKGAWSCAFFLPKVPLATIKTKELIVDRKQNIKINIATIYNKNFKVTDIPEPTAEQLNIISKNCSFNSLPAQWNNLEEWRKNDASSIVEINVLTGNKKRPVINQEEAREIYYKLQEFEINEHAAYKYEKEYLDNITDKELYKHYEDHLNTLNEELKTITKYSKILKKILLNKSNTQQFKAIPTYNGLGNTMTKPQHELITDLIRKNKSEDDKKILREILAKHVLEDKDFTKEQKEEILQFIENNKSNKIIENCLMFPLTRDEKRVLRELRAEIYEQIQTGKITASGVTDPQTGITEPEVYIAHISYDKFFTLYGVNKDNHKATKPIKDILFGRSSNGLYKQIIVEHQPAITTQLILQIKEKKKKINLHKKEVDTGFTITMPSFLFVGEEKQDAKDYYNQEDEGYRRFITTGNMAQSDAASNIIHKLEMLCHSTLHNKKKKEQVLKIDLDTMVNIAGYQKRYKGMPKETKAKIDKILNNMIETKYLIESFQLKKGKYGQEQYIIKPLKFIEN